MLCTSTQKIMEKSLLHDDFVLFNKKLARLKEKTRHLQREDISRKNGEEPEEIKIEEENCGFCKGEENSESAHVHIQDLCPADRKRIARLVEKLAECTQAKNKLELNFAEVKAQNEALLDRYELFTTKQEEEKNHLRSQLLEKTQELDKFHRQTSNSLELLVDQVKAQEEVYLKLTNTVKELLRERIRLENSVTERDNKIRLIEAKMERFKENLKIKKLLSLGDTDENDEEYRENE